MRGDPDLALTVDIYGIAQDGAKEAYGARLRARAAEDPRLRLLPTLPGDQVLQTLAEYDVLLVPSAYVETGPLVVLEAFAAGIPVIGSRLGGIAERVRDEVDGLLVESGSIEGWRRALRRVVGERDLLDRLRRGVRDPRTMAEVSVEMAALYRSLAAPPALHPWPNALLATQH
jgi:glycosyltransferase involved in cell wall biosynthesis